MKRTSTLPPSPANSGVRAWGVTIIPPSLAPSPNQSQPNSSRISEQPALRQLQKQHFQLPPQQSPLFNCLQVSTSRGDPKRTRLKPKRSGLMQRLSNWFEDHLSRPLHLSRRAQRSSTAHQSQRAQSQSHRRPLAESSSRRRASNGGAGGGTCKGQLALPSQPYSHSISYGVGSGVSGNGNDYQLRQQIEKHQQEQRYRALCRSAAARSVAPPRQRAQLRADTYHRDEGNTNREKEWADWRNGNVDVRDPYEERCKRPLSCYLRGQFRARHGHRMGPEGL